MNLPSLQQPKTLFLFALTAALLGILPYGGYRCWQSRQIIPEPQVPAEEKAYEIVDNPDGSRTFVCYKFGFKVTYPDTWEFSEKYSSFRYEAGALEIFRGSDQTDILFSVWAPRNQDRYPTLWESLVGQDGLAGLSPDPNFTVAGLPAFRYGLLERLQARDVEQTVFENDEHVFAISISWDHRNDPEYAEILNSFKLTD